MTKIIDGKFEVDENNALIKYHEINGITEVVVPDDVTQIKGAAFFKCENLTSIILPNSVTEIGMKAFTFCKQLENIILPETITKIGIATFRFDTSIKNVTIPKNITKIEMSTFSYCSSIREINIPENIIEIDDFAFLGCSSLINIILSKNITYISNKAFYECYNIQNIVVPSYKVFSLLIYDLKLIALISTIKNYYTGKIKYSEEDMNLFKEYIRKNKIEIFEQQKNNKEIIKIILCDMGNFLTTNDIDELLSQNIEPEINTMLLEYSNKIRNEETNPLVDLDLGEFEDNLGIAK